MRLLRNFPLEDLENLEDLEDLEDLVTLDKCHPHLGARLANDGFIWLVVDLD